VFDCVKGFAFQFQLPKRRREFFCLIISEKKYDMTKYHEYFLMKSLKEKSQLPAKASNRAACSS